MIVCYTKGAMVVMSIFKTHRLFAAQAICAFLCIICSLPLAASQAENSFTEIDDRIIGRGHRGPYILAWNKFDAESISITINGMPLRRGRDFSSDNVQGMVTFDSILLKDAIAHVRYKVIQGKSEQTGGKINIPVTFNLFQGKNADIKIKSVYVQDDANDPNKSRTLIGLDTSNKISNTTITSQMSVSQGNSGGDSFGDRALYRVGTSSDFGKLKITGSYLHSGNNFNGEKEMGITAGRNSQNFLAVFNPSSKISVSAGFTANENTGDSDTASKTTTNKQSIVIDPSDATKISIARTLTQTGQNGDSSEREVTNITVGQKLGDVATASAILENTDLSNSSSKDSQSTRQLNISGGKNGISVRGSLTQKESDSKGSEDIITAGASFNRNDKLNLDFNIKSIDNQNEQRTNQDVRFTLKPVEAFSLAASLSASDAVRNGVLTQSNTTDLRLITSPTRYTKLTAMLTQKDINNNSDISRGATIELTPGFNTKLIAGVSLFDNGFLSRQITDYSASTNPFSFIKVSANMRERESNMGDLPDTQAMKVALNPVKSLTFEGDYNYNPENNRGEVQNLKSTGLGMKMRVGSVYLITNVARKFEYLTSKQWQQRRLGMEMLAFGGGKLSTGVEVNTSTIGSDNSNMTYTLGYNRNLGSSFNLMLSGNYTQYYQDSIQLKDNDELKAQASLGIKF